MRVRWGFMVAALMVALLGATILPALAQGTTYSGSQTVGRGQTQVVVSCGTSSETWASGQASWYTKDPAVNGAKHLATTDGTQDPNTPTSGVFIVPDKRARFVTYNFACEPIPPPA